MQSYNLEESLRALGSSKATERKNGASSLKDLLETEAVIKTLDGNSETSSGTGWNVVFKVYATLWDRTSASGNNFTAIDFFRVSWKPFCSCLHDWNT